MARNFDKRGEEATSKITTHRRLAPINGVDTRPCDAGSAKHANGKQVLNPLGNIPSNGPSMINSAELILFNSL